PGAILTAPGARRKACRRWCRLRGCRGRMDTPQRFGTCRVVERIASGTVTDVFRAVREPIGQEVAVKALRASISPGSPFAARLAQEAGVLAGLTHERVVRLYDFVADARAWWLVLEYVEGWPASHLAARGRRLPLESALAIAVDLAGALAHAHARGIVHRDVTS